MDILNKLESMISEKKSKSDVIPEIMEFFRDNPNPSDDEIHNLADTLGVDSHEFESYIYSILGSFLGAGRAKEDGFTEDMADPEELKKGIEIEYEHTNNPEISKRIALDHLSEIDDYYTRLIKMEKEAGE